MSLNATGKGGSRCERIVITTGDGRVFDLGRPDSPIFWARKRIYMWRRRTELRAVRGD